MPLLLAVGMGGGGIVECKGRILEDYNDDHVVVKNKYYRIWTKATSGSQASNVCRERQCCDIELTRANIFED